MFECSDLRVFLTQYQVHNIINTKALIQLVDRVQYDLNAVFYIQLLFRIAAVITVAAILDTINLAEIVQ
ncbi:hypothetical protein D3C87_1470280 [compost metagenome]